MVWTDPKRFQEGEILTARDLNVYLRDNLLENEVMKATSSGSHFSTDAGGNLVERAFGYDAVSASETAVSGAMVRTGPSSWVSALGPVNLGTPGPKVTIETGHAAIVMYSARLKSSTFDWGITEGVGIDVPTSPSLRLTSGFFDSPIVNQGVLYDQLKDTSPNYSQLCVITGLTPGMNTFVMRYRLPVSDPIFTSGQLTGWNDVQCTYSNRHLLVLPL